MDKLHTSQKQLIDFVHIVHFSFKIPKFEHKNVFCIHLNEHDKTYETCLFYFV